MDTLIDQDGKVANRQTTAAKNIILLEINSSGSYSLRPSVEHKA